MTLVDVYPIGVIRMIDQGKLDEKIIAIPFSDPNYNIYHSVYELPKHIFSEMCHFFTVYKQLEEKDTAVDDLDGPEEAKKIIADAIDSYERLYGGKKTD